MRKGRLAHHYQGWPLPIVIFKTLLRTPAHTLLNLNPTNLNIYITQHETYRHGTRCPNTTHPKPNTAKRIPLHPHREEPWIASAHIEHLPNLETYRHCQSPTHYRQSGQNIKGYVEHNYRRCPHNLETIPTLPPEQNAVPSVQGGRVQRLQREERSADTAW